MARSFATGEYLPPTLEYKSVDSSYFEETDDDRNPVDEQMILEQTRDHLYHEGTGSLFAALAAGRRSRRRLAGDLSARAIAPSDEFRVSPRKNIT